MKKPIRIAVMFDNFGPYHLTRLNAVAKQMNLLAVEFYRVSSIYDWNMAKGSEKLHSCCLFDTQINSQSWKKISEAFDKNVLPFRPELIAIPGWSSPIAIRALVWAVDKNIPVILMSESNSNDFVRISLLEIVKKIYVKYCSAGLVGGDQAKCYLGALGMPEKSISLGYNVVDNQYFSERALAIKQLGIMPILTENERLDSHWRGRYFLASSRFIPKKNLLTLIEAYAAYYKSVSKIVDAWPLIILGDGPLSDQLKARTRSLTVDSNVYFPGFKQYEELPDFYATAGAFVHVSTREQWGLVVNEAMASELPIIVSNRCGCADMLLEEGKNGYIVDPFNMGSIKDAFQKITSHEDLEILGKRSKEIIDEWNPSRFSIGLKRATDTALQIENRQISILDRTLFRILAALQARRS